MFLAGIISLLQITFMPGLLALRLFKYKTNSFIQKLIYVFAISLLINYILVFSLTLLQIYTYNTLFIILFIELVLLIKLLKRTKLSIWVPIPRFQNNVDGIFPFILIAVSLFLIGHFLGLVILNFNPESVFITGDAIDSWNGWAIAWSKNMIPSNSFHYPQLIPANWSISYVLMQTSEIQLFAKAIMPLFSLFILLIFWDLAAKSQKTYYLVSLIATGYLIKYFFDSAFIRDGYVDLALTFFGLLTLYSILNLRRGDRYKNMFLVILFDSAAFFTKQTGIFIVLLTGVWLYRLFKSRVIKLSKKQKFRIFCLSTILASFAAIWIIPKLGSISAYKAYSLEEIVKTTSVGQKSYFSRVTFAVRGLFNGIRSIIFLFTTGLFYGLSFFDKRSRKISAFFILPIFLFWAFFLSYDKRNLSLLFPFFGYVSGVGFDYIVKKIKALGSVGEKLPKAEILFSAKINLKAFVVFLLLTVVAAYYFVPDNYLLYMQLQGKKEIGEPSLNSVIYGYFKREKISGRILTNYLRLTYLPGFRKHAFYKKGLIDAEDVGKQDILYILYMEGNLDLSILESANRSYKKIFQYGQWHLVEKI